MTGWRRAAAAATLDAWSRPSAWLVALAGALVRGSFALLLLPILVLPTTTGLATALGPLVTSIVLGPPAPDAWLVVGSGTAAGLGWLAVAALVGAATDVWLIRAFGGGADGVGGGPVVVGRVLVARLLAGLPLALVLVWASGRLASATYAELVMPSDFAAPLPARVVAAAPEALVVLAGVWLAVEVVASLASRRIVLSGRGVGGALGSASGSALRHPAGPLAALVTQAAIWLLLIGPAVIMTMVAWGWLRGLLLDDAGPALVATGVLAFSGLWLGAMLLVGIASAWTSAIWTAEVRRSPLRVPTPGVTTVSLQPSTDHGRLP